MWFNPTKDSNLCYISTLHSFGLLNSHSLSDLKGVPNMAISFLLPESKLWNSLPADVFPDSYYLSFCFNRQVYHHLKIETLCLFLLFFARWKPVIKDPTTMRRIGHCTNYKAPLSLKVPSFQGKIQGNYLRNGNPDNRHGTDISVSNFTFWLWGITQDLEKFL